MRPAYSVRSRFLRAGEQTLDEFGERDAFCKERTPQLEKSAPVGFRTAWAIQAAAAWSRSSRRQSLSLVVHMRELAAGCGEAGSCAPHTGSTSISSSQPNGRPLRASDPSEQRYQYDIVIRQH